MTFKVKHALLAALFIFVGVPILICLIGGILNDDDFTESQLRKMPVFTFDIFEDWKNYKGEMYKYEGFIDSVNEDELIIKMELYYPPDDDTYTVNVVIEKDDKMDYPISDWENPIEDSYAVVVGELKKTKYGIFSGRNVYISNWYYDSISVESYYTEIEMAKQKELEEELEKQRLEEQERILKEQAEELENIILKLQNTPFETSQLQKIRELKMELEKFKIKYSNYSKMEDVDDAIKYAEELITMLEIKEALEAEEQREIEERKKEREERKKSMDMTPLSIREGYYELDEILRGIEQEIVPSDKVSRFRKLYEMLGYYSYTDLKPGQATKIAEEIHSIVRTPNDKTELNKYIDRFDFFIERCPDFSKDDDLNHRYEVIALILRGLNK